MRAVELNFELLKSKKKRIRSAIVKSQTKRKTDDQLQIADELRDNYLEFFT